ncbi:zinc-binding dehydrogenase [Streptomyces sp. CA-253872]|uniref:zinc-binding dehydrogenase n=1 Tax=Streptomyces sp. CA-253872 TaxID=3240067 RepID=UPI003D8A9FC8
MEGPHEGRGLNISFAPVNPALYCLMHGDPRPGRGGAPAAEAAFAHPSAYVRRVAEAGRLRVPEEHAARVLQGAGSGTALALIALPEERRDLTASDLTRETVIAALTTEAPASAAPGPAGAAVTLRALLPQVTVLTDGERQLMAEWLGRGAGSLPAGRVPPAPGRSRTPSPLERAPSVGPPSRRPPALSVDPPAMRHVSKKSMRQVLFTYFPRRTVEDMDDNEVPAPPADPRALRTRRRLRDAVLEAASLRPVEEVSVTELAKAAGINRATFYHHATDPAALLRAAFAEEYDALRAGFVDVAARPGGDVAAAARTTFRGLAAHVDAHASLYTCNVVGGNGHALSRFVAEHISRTIAALLTARPELLPPHLGHDAFMLRVASRKVGYGTLGVLATWLQEPAPRDIELLTSTVLALLPDWMTGERERPTAAPRPLPSEPGEHPHDHAPADARAVRTVRERSTTGMNTTGTKSTGTKSTVIKASVTREQGKGFSVEEVELAAPIGREVKVDVRASGLCHSDLTWATTPLGAPFPTVLGHEVAGVVTAVGPDVTSIAPGDHVVGSLIQFCGNCVNCLAGRTYICRNKSFTLRTPEQPARLTLGGEPINQGFGLGGFAQQALIHENQLAVIPREMPWAPAALLGCGVLTGAGAVLNSANVQTGESVVVMGAGGVGMNALSGAKLAGAEKIIVTDIEDGKLERAKAFGATHTVNSRTSDPVAAVKEITGGGADHVFDFVGARPVTRQGWEMLGLGGGLYLVGIHPTGGIDVPGLGAIASAGKVQGVVMGSSHLKRHIPMYASLYLQGRLNLDDLISKTIPLDEIDAGYEALKDGSTARVVVTDLS